MNSNLELDVFVRNRFRSIPKLIEIKSCNDYDMYCLTGASA